MENIFRKCVLLYKRKHLRKGFSLLEVLVVTLVIGVLAAIAVPSYNKSVKKSRVSDALNNLEIVSTKQQDFLINNERYAETFAELKLPMDFSGVSEDGKKGTIGNFEYTLSKGCVKAKYSGNDSYTIGRNSSNEVFCIDGNCKFISDLVSTGKEGEVFQDCGFSVTDDPGPEECNLECKKTCSDGSEIFGYCVLAPTPQCVYSPDCQGKGTGTNYDCEGGISNGSTGDIGGCLYTCQNGNLTRTGVSEGYVWNEKKQKCLQNMCSEGTVQKNTVEGKHYCRTWTQGLWEPEGWTKECAS